ncbi:MAG: thioredoxin domain-containing protein [Dermatophilaceae bacterium]
MANRLAGALSPYLRQHEGNPVDWWEWGQDAFAEAARRDVPVFLSVGYAACHWCHVMAHESFEDEQVAAALADGFVAVKVDREERPDVDALYMAATTAMTGHAGWPMTVLMTADGEPFWCGTYLPKGSLLALLGAARQAWATRRGEVDASAAQVAEAVRAGFAPPAGYPVDEAVLAHAVTALAAGFDHDHGGFGGAPKFPPSMVLEFLVRHHARTGSTQARTMVDGTCEAMARGGMYDQLGGGFARYVVDATWVIPHFEKMLYDNAQLARVYAHWWRLTGAAVGQRVARETCEFMLRDLLTPEGGFAASLDADTHGVEGLTYVWSPAQLAEVLGPSDGAQAAELLGVTAEGTFEHGRSTLRLPRDPQDVAWWRRARQRLLESRLTRPQPARDDKVVTSWNGLAVAALADVGALLGERAYVAAAARAADHVLTTHVTGASVRRVSRAGVAGSAQAVADDYGNLVEGLLALHQATGQARWLHEAGALLDAAVERFGDGDRIVRDTPADGERLVAVPFGASDNAEPSGRSALAGALLGYGALTGSTRHLDLAQASLAGGGAVALRDPRFAGWTLAVAEALAAGPLQVAVVGTGDPADALVRVVRASASPGLVHVAGMPDAPGIPLLAGRALVDGGPAAYVCRGFVCDRPVTTPDALATALAR